MITQLSGVFMRRRGSRLFLGVALLFTLGHVEPLCIRRADASTPQAAGEALPLDDFEAEAAGWRFIGGEEFPGAKGALRRDTTRAHGGKACSRLEADFRGGGAYVGN